MSQHQENKDNAHGKQVEAYNSATANVADTININHYQLSRPPRGIPFQALALPKDYVDRPEIRQKIKSKLIDCSVSRPGTLVVSAIYGLGGVGKSVMAAALAHDKDVQEVCADGVLWVTLGQNPDLLSSLYDWVQKLGDYDFKPTNVDSASGHLRNLLHDKKMLLVVDDAWHTDHVVPFQVGGDGCRVLVTTREAEVLDADRIDMDVMSEAEALKLLLSKAQIKSLTVEEEQQARKLIAVVGGLPLAVDLAGAQIADGMSWSELLEDLEAEIAYLDALDRPNFEGVMDEKTRKRLSLKASLNLSLKLLSSEQLQQFAWLGVLPEDVAIQPDMAATLWSIPRRKAGAVLRAFRAKALLLSGVQGVGQEFSYRIHDLMHDLARGLLTGKGEKDIPGLDLQWSDAHGILLDQYRQPKDIPWHTVSDDGYFHTNLTWHMEQACKLNEVHLLFIEVTDDGRNGWYESCEYLGRNTRFVNDLGRALRLAQEMYSENASRSIELQFRYALIFSTLNSIANNTPSRLISILISKKKWTHEQGWICIQQSQNPHRQSEIIKEVAKYLPPSLLQQTFYVACEIQNESSRARALSYLVEYLPEDMLLDVLDAARDINDKSSRVRILICLANYFPWIASEIFHLVCEIKDEASFSKALNYLAKHLPDYLLNEALEMISGIKNKSCKVDVLRALAPYLSRELSLKALDVISKTNHLPSIVIVKSVFLPHFPESRLEVLSAISSLKDEHKKAVALEIFLTNSSQEMHLEILHIAREIKNEIHKITILQKLAKCLPEIISEALDLACTIENKKSKAISMSLLAKHLSYEQLSELLNITGEIESNSSKSKIIARMARHLPENLLLEALYIVERIQSKHAQSSILSSLAIYLPDHLLLKSLNIARAINDEFYRAKALCGLLPYISEILPEAISAARVIQNEIYKARALSDLVIHTSELASEALESAHAIQNITYRVKALSSLVVNIPSILPEVLDLASRMNHGSSKTKAVSKLTDYMPEYLRLQSLEEKYPELVLRCSLIGHFFSSEEDCLNVFQLVVNTKDDRYRSIALRNFSHYMTKDLFSKLLNRIHQVDNEQLKVKMLKSLIEILPKSMLIQILSIAQSIDIELYKCDVLLSLASLTSEDLSVRILDMARSIKDELLRTKLISRLINGLPENMFLDALKITNEMKGENCKIQIYSSIFTQKFLKSFDLLLWSEFLRISSLKDRKYFLEDIPKLAPAIIHLSDRSTLNLVVQAMREVCQQWP